MVVLKRFSYKPSFQQNEKKLGEYVESADLLKFADSHTDASYFQSTSETVESFMASGKILADNKALKYDFADGKDDGSDVPLTRSVSDPSDISQALHDEESRLESVGKKRKEKADVESDRKELISAIQDAASSKPSNVSSASESTKSVSLSQ